jgi:hypothetical protein
VSKIQNAPKSWKLQNGKIHLVHSFCIMDTQPVYGRIRTYISSALGAIALHPWLFFLFLCSFFLLLLLELGFELKVLHILDKVFTTWTWPATLSAFGYFPDVMLRFCPGLAWPWSSCLQPLCSGDCRHAAPCPTYLLRWWSHYLFSPRLISLQFFASWVVRDYRHVHMVFFSRGHCIRTLFPG